MALRARSDLSKQLHLLHRLRGDHAVDEEERDAHLKEKGVQKLELRDTPAKFSEWPAGHDGGEEEADVAQAAHLGEHRECFRELVTLRNAHACSIFCVHGL